MSRRFRTIAALAGAGALTATLLTGALPAQAAKYGVVSASAPLRDFAPTVANPTDGGYATLVVAEKGNRSSFVLVVNGLSAAPGTRYGVHVHTGPCVAGEPTTAGPHWRTAASDPIDAHHEVWLDFKVTNGGNGKSKAKVPFVIPTGSARSVVIHAMPTASDGSAGPRLACLPVAF